MDREKEKRRKDIFTKVRGLATAKGMTRFPTSVDAIQKLEDVKIILEALIDDINEKIEKP